MGKFFGKKEVKKENNINKNKKLSGNSIKIKINRLLNGTPVEIANFKAELTRDDNNNTVIFDDDKMFKEEMPGIQDTLVSDILYKLKSRNSTKDKQVLSLEKLIKNQEKIIGEEKGGFIINEVEGFDELTKKTVKIKKEVKINRQTEMSKLRILKCSLYALENKEGDGFFESIDIEGNRTLTYVLIDGELIPYWFKTPSNNGEPVILVPDVVSRKKFFKESETEAIQDFNEGVDWFWKGWLGVAMKLLTVVFLASLIIWAIFLARWQGDLYDESLEPRIQELQLENQRIAQSCNNQMSRQMENNWVIFDYANSKMQEEINNPGGTNLDKSDIKI